MRRRGFRFARGVKLWAAGMAVTLMAAAPSFAGDPLFVVFAKCTGRLSAEMEHQWLVQKRPVETIKAQRAAFIEFTDAIIPDGYQRHALSLRIESKFAHRALLMRADFNENPSDARWAADRAERERLFCVGLLLS